MANTILVTGSRSLILGNSVPTILSSGDTLPGDLDEPWGTFLLGSTCTINCAPSLPQQIPPKTPEP